MDINSKMQNQNHPLCKSTLIELSIQQGQSSQVRIASPEQENLEHLVLQLRVVNTNTARAQLHPVEHDVVGL